MEPADNACTISVVIPVYRDASRAIEALESLGMQELPDGVGLDVVVVDDGSGDGTAELIKARAPDFARIIALPANRGRSKARNIGASHAKGRTIVFMDCDCSPVQPRFLQSHWDAINRGHAASTGHVTGIDGNFWDKYQRDSSARRARQHAQGIAFAGSSQNLAVSKDAFETIGGFDEDFLAYGFEDRDLLIRLSQQAGIAWTDTATVRHHDTLNLPGVCAKMMQAGETTGLRFACIHPQEYRALGYAAIDVRQHGWLRRLDKLVGVHIARLANATDGCLDCPWLPYRCKKAMVKLITALAYMRGTTLAEKPDAD